MSLASSYEDSSPGLGVNRRKLDLLTKTWGNWDSVSLYLQRCQVETPDELVKATWRHVEESRSSVGQVIDFGAGNGRFSRYGRYREYVGYEIDSSMFSDSRLPDRANLVNQCAFSEPIIDADVCIGNPPFVRNQDLPRGWRQHASKVLHERTGVLISGLANAWQYFFFLSLISTNEQGLCALIIPYEWVSRPSAKAIRDFIVANGWSVSVYRLIDTRFSSVLTTSSITIVDKAKCNGKWDYFEETAGGAYSRLSSPSGGPDGVIPYQRRSAIRANDPYARRGLSPGTQKVLTLSEGERVRSGLRIGRDVVPCVTTLRQLPNEVRDLEERNFKSYFRTLGQKSWLIRTDRNPSRELSAYLTAVPEASYQTSTCLEREQWWKFAMPAIPQVLIAMSFRGKFPKAVRNSAGVRAVGGVYGIYNLSASQVNRIISGFDGVDISQGVVAHSNGLRKIEISQLNTLLIRAFGAQDGVPQ